VRVMTSMTRAELACLRPQLCQTHSCWSLALARPFSMYQREGVHPANSLHRSSPIAAASQDENRHGDFFTAVLKVQPQFLDDWRARAWSKFFCLSVYVTMYLNDHQRSAFYESLGLNTTQFNRRAFPPAVLAH